MGEAEDVMRVMIVPINIYGGVITLCQFELESVALGVAREKLPSAEKTLWGKKLRLGMARKVALSRLSSS
jgi:hypothetical protein